MSPVLLQGAALLSSPDYSDGGQHPKTFTPNRLPVKKTPISMWDVLILQDAYNAQVEAELAQAKKKA